VISDDWGVTALGVRGRIDNQVKIRGHRVEPAEAEMALLEHRDVREASVIAFEAEPGNSRLVAHVAPHKLAASSIGGRERYRLPIIWRGPAEQA